MKSQSGARIRKLDDIPLRLGYLVSHPIQYQAPLLRRIAIELDIDLTVLFSSDFSVRGYKDHGFGVEVLWDTPLLEGYKHEFLRPWRKTQGKPEIAPISRGLWKRLRTSDGSPAFDALWIHGYSSLNSLQAIVAANALGIPVLLRAESWLADRERSVWKLAAKHLFFRVLRKGIAAVLPIGTLNARYWTHYFGDKVPQFLTPYAVDNEFFSRLAEAAEHQRLELSAELNLDPHRRVILFASKLQERKHADHLLDAYNRFIAHKALEDQPYLIIVGDGEQSNAIRAKAKQLNLAGVRFAGFRNQSELPRFFNLADVFVLPSRHEPWGLIVNEAMACGCAVIVSSDVGSHVDLVCDGVQGCVFPVGDIPALSDALQRVFETKDSAATMGKSARQRIASWTFEEDVQGLRAALAAVTRKLKA